MHVQGLLWVGSLDCVAWGVPAGELAAADTHASVTLESSFGNSHSGPWKNTPVNTQFGVFRAPGRGFPGGSGNQNLPTMQEIGVNP